MPFKYRADHVGSFLRPQELLDVRTGPNVTAAQLKEIEDRHIQRILARQQDLGFTIFTDGELRRRGFMSDFHDSVEGLDHDGSIARAWLGEKPGATPQPQAALSGIVVAKIRQAKRLTRHEAEYLKQH